MWKLNLIDQKQANTLKKPQTATLLSKGLVASFCLALIAVSSFAQASTSYTTSWTNVYGSSGSLTNTGTGCKLCHTSDSGGYVWNGYGYAIYKASGDIETRISAVQGQDSDGDPAGSSNLAEITANTQPGWTDGAANKTYDTNGEIANGLVSPPAGISGNLDIPEATYTVGGSISGLTGSVTLRNNDENLVRSENGIFTFDTPLPDGSNYAVTVFAQPEGLLCSVTEGTGSGTIAEANITDVAVVCRIPTYTVGGTISGLSGTVTLQNNAGDDLEQSTNGEFTFANALSNESSYDVTVSEQPGGQTCSVTEGTGSGTIAAANITDVAVICVSTFGVAHVEWEAIGFLDGFTSEPIPFMGNSGLVIIGLVLLLIGIHHIRRQRSAALRILALFAISSGVLISTQGSYQFIEMARAATSILLTVSPEPLVLGDNSVKNVQSQRIQITALPSNTCVIDQSMSDASPCAVGTILYPEESCQVYVSCDINTPKEPSPDEFLQFLNPPAQDWTEEKAEIAATEYYQVIDPNGDRDTLEKWKTEVGFDAGYDSVATYVNDTDLGFGRQMFVRKNIGDGSVASYVENYPTIQDAIDRTNLIATVAMEYSSPDGIVPKFTQFYTFGPNGDQLLAVDLDGRGERFQPDVCLVCHGGTPKPSYTSLADTNVGAGFLPWDLETFVYAPVPVRLSREAQEGEFKKFNRAALDTNPTAAAREMVEGWYGGAGLPGDFNGEFVPDLWWTSAVDENDVAVDSEEAKTLYQDVVAPYCRACHVMRTPYFASYKEFDVEKSTTKSLVFDQGTMPLALRTFEKFWHNPDDVNILADFVGIAPDPEPPEPPAP